MSGHALIFVLFAIFITRGDDVRLRIAANWARPGSVLAFLGFPDSFLTPGS